MLLKEKMFALTHCRLKQYTKYCNPYCKEQNVIHRENFHRLNIVGSVIHLFPNNHFDLDGHGEEDNLTVFGDTSGNRSARYQAKLIILFT